MYGPNSTSWKFKGTVHIGYDKEGYPKPWSDPPIALLNSAKLQSTLEAGRIEREQIVNMTRESEQEQIANMSNTSEDAVKANATKVSSNDTNKSELRESEDVHNLELVKRFDDKFESTINQINNQFVMGKISVRVGHQG